jgi:hypothetical protein
MCHFHHALKLNEEALCNSLCTSQQSKTKYISRIWRRKGNSEDRFHYFIRKQSIKIATSSKSYEIGYSGAKLSGEEVDGAHMDGGRQKNECFQKSPENGCHFLHGSCPECLC